VSLGALMKCTAGPPTHGLNIHHRTAVEEGWNWTVKPDRDNCCRRVVVTHS
jgi:hypothetical protein